MRHFAPYQLWDADTANMVGEYDTEEEARAAHAGFADPDLMVLRVDAIGPGRPAVKVIVPRERTSPE